MHWPIRPGLTDKVFRAILFALWDNMVEKRDVLVANGYVYTSPIGPNPHPFPGYSEHGWEGGCWWRWGN